jgi:hypothetical protein
MRFLSSRNSTWALEIGFAFFKVVTQIRLFSDENLPDMPIFVTCNNPLK